MGSVGVDVTLVSGRTLKQGRGMEIGKLSKEYFDAVAICEVDSTTIEVLGLEEGDSVKVETDFGSVIVMCTLDRRAEPGVAFMPCGPYANLIIASDTLESGMPGFKTVPAKLFPAKGEPVLSVEELLKEAIK